VVMGGAFVRLVGVFPWRGVVGCGVLLWCFRLFLVVLQWCIVSLAVWWVWGGYLCSFMCFVGGVGCGMFVGCLC